MDDGDNIKIFTKDQLSSSLPFEEIPEPEPEVDEDRITIQVRTNEKTYKFGIARTDTFQKLFDGFCSHTNLDPKTVKFIFDGEDLDLSSTPEDEDLEDDDLIDVKISDPSSRAKKGRKK